MAFTTLRAFVDALADLDIDGVRRKRKVMPTEINRADLPMSYVRIPDASRSTSTLSYGMDLRHGVAELVVVVAPMLTGTQERNFYATVDMVDAIADALVTNAAALGMDGYEIRSEEDTMGDVAYWALVARVEASG